MRCREPFRSGSYRVLHYRLHSWELSSECRRARMQQLLSRNDLSQSICGFCKLRDLCQRHLSGCRCGPVHELFCRDLSTCRGRSALRRLRGGLVSRSHGIVYLRALRRRQVSIKCGVKELHHGLPCRPVLGRGSRRVHAVRLRDVPGEYWLIELCELRYGHG